MTVWGIALVAAGLWAYFTKGLYVRLLALPLAVMVKLGLNKAGMGKSGSGYKDWKAEGNVGGPF